ncbi:UDP-glycosyltransferase 92A1 [Linum perenne]
MAGGNNHGGHILMLPVTAHGHLIPFLALARQILRRRPSLTITIATTPLNINYLRSSLDPASDSNIIIASLPFRAADHGLPPDAENAGNLTAEMRLHLYNATTSLASPVRDLVAEIANAGRPPACIISDVFFGWATEVAAGFGIRNFTFSTCGAYGSLGYMSVWMNLPHRKAMDSGGKDDFSVPGFPDEYRFQLNQLHKIYRDADGTDGWSKFFRKQIAGSMKSDGWLCNSAEEVEPLGLKLLAEFVKRRIWAIGPLLPPEICGQSSTKSSINNNTQHRAGKTPGVSRENCIQWLQSHEPGSVLYICFGSQNSITQSQMMQLATGLEQSSKPFLWVTRPPIGFDPNSKSFNQEWLPEGFEHRVQQSKTGLLVRNWAPQLDILAHASTGAFLSHCGWNSIVESLSQGVPIVAWPLAAEQGFNAKMVVEEIGAGVELARGTESEVESLEVKRVIEFAMGEEGKEMKRKAEQVAKHLMAAVRDGDSEKGSSVKAMDDFLDTVLLANG